VSKPSPFAGRVKPSPKPIAESQETYVRVTSLGADTPMPVVVTPAVDDLDHLSWLEANRAWLDARLHARGAILFRGFPIGGPSDFEALASRLTTGLYGDYGDLPRSDTDKVYGVTPYPPEGTILFHNESSHMHQWPMRQMFFCDVAALEGGETPIVDGRTIYAALEPELRAKLEAKKLRYVRNFIKGVDVSWQDFFKTDDRGVVEAYCRAHGIEYAWKGENDLMTYQIAPAVVDHPVTGEKVFFNQIQLHHVSCLGSELRQAMERMFPPDDLPRNVYLGDGEVLTDEEVAAITALYWAHAVAFRWHGDVLLVDNMLVSHARKPYTPPRQMFVAMGDLIRAETL
jgi:alpha-ketoglutarate-dependent taurine dioxygenase